MQRFRLLQGTIWPSSKCGRPIHGDKRAASVNGCFMFLYTAAAVLDACSLIPLLFKSVMSDYTVLALHNATKIRQNLEKIKGLRFGTTI